MRRLFYARIGVFLIGSLKTKSLRFWVGLGMLVALLPVVASAAGGYLLLNWGVIAPFHDVLLVSASRSSRRKSSAS